MAEELSRDEVDALLKGGDDGEVALTEETAPPGTVRPAPLVRAAGESPERRFPGLTLLHERFARELASSLGALFESTVAVERGEIVALDFATLRNRLAPGAVLSVFSLAPLPGQGMLALPPALAFEMVDRLFGGPGAVPDAMRRREPSPIALRTIERIALRVLGALAAAWQPVARVDCALVRTDATPLLAAIAGPGDAVVSLESACDLGGGASPAWVVLPEAPLEAVRAKLEGPRGTPPRVDRAWLGALRAAIEGTEVVVTADLGRVRMSAREVLALRPGDVLDVATRGDDPLAVRVEGTVLFTGQAGVSRGRNAVRLLGGDVTGLDLEE
ncbi:MAG: FliM/FliN family flagellar motor switch protein [Thermodesulfobacteriota bacterium]